MGQIGRKRPDAQQAARGAVAARALVVDEPADLDSIPF
jgi:hypothetical protein